MKNSNIDDSTEHIKDLKLAYLEDLLTPEERAGVEDHLRSCLDCSKELTEMRRWASILQENQEVFCPEPWEIFDLVRRGEVATGEFAGHLVECSSCREIVEEFKARPKSAAVPRKLWARMQDLSRNRARYTDRITWTEKLSLLTDRLSTLFRPPVLAFATVAAALLVAVMLLPTLKSQPVVGLSSVKWEPNVLERKLMGPDEAPFSPEVEGVPPKRLAFIILFEDFKHPLEQEKIDSLYRDLKPTVEIRQRFDVVTPAEVRGAVAQRKVNVSDRNDILRGMHDALGVSRAVLITVTSRGDRFDVQREVTDTSTRKVIQEQVVKGLTENELHSEIKSGALSVFHSQ